MEELAVWRKSHPENWRRGRMGSNTVSEEPHRKSTKFPTKKEESWFGPNETFYNKEMLGKNGTTEKKSALKMKRISDRWLGKLAVNNSPQDRIINGRVEGEKNNREKYCEI